MKIWTLETFFCCSHCVEKRIEVGHLQSPGNFRIIMFHRKEYISCITHCGLLLIANKLPDVPYFIQFHSVYDAFVPHPVNVVRKITKNHTNMCVSSSPLFTRTMFLIVVTQLVGPSLISVIVNILKRERTFQYFNHIDTTHTKLLDNLL